MYSKYIYERCVLKWCNTSAKRVRNKLYKETIVKFENNSIYI